MSHIIFTRDQYFSTAIAALLKDRQSGTVRYCVIDLESCRSLAHLRWFLLSTDITPSHILVFIGGRGICTKMLKPLVSLHRKSPTERYDRQFNWRSGCHLHSVLKMIDAYRQLEGLTKLETLTVYALRIYPDIHHAARFVMMAPKTVYSRSRKIGIKLNLDTLQQLNQFIHAEFSFEDAGQFFRERRMALPERHITP